MSDYKAQWLYTPLGHVFGIYCRVILFEGKARKQAHSKLCNCLCNAADKMADQKTAYVAVRSIPSYLKIGRLNGN
jgi:hypothetical protein